MPIKNAAIKDLRQNIKRAAHHQKIKSDISALIRKIKKALVAKDSAKAVDWFKQTVKKIDKAVAKKILKKNTAARMKSRLSKAVSAVAKK